jgi:MFS family permease
MSITLLLIMNGAGIPGRLIPNYLSDLHFNPLDTMIPFAFASSISLFCWIAVTSVPGLIVFSVVFGVLASGLLSLFPAVLSSITADLSRTGVRLGMVMSGIGFACLTGPPIAGALVEGENGSYLHAQLFAGVVVMVGALFLVLLRIRKARLEKRTEPDQPQLLQ